MQLRLHHLAVAALLKATDLAEMEGASGLDALGAGAPAFGVLRRLVEVGYGLLSQQRAQFEGFA